MMTKGAAFMEFLDLLNTAVYMQASDIIVKPDLLPVARVHGELRLMEGSRIFVGRELEESVKKLLNLDDDEDSAGRVPDPMVNERVQRWMEQKSLDFSFFLRDVGRFRLHVFMERGKWCVVARTIPSEIRSLGELGLPERLFDLVQMPRGLFLVTGPTGSGKSTTLNTLVNYLNENFAKHIVTIEDPIEFHHKNLRSVISQREVGSDTLSFRQALKDSLRENPDVILVGEMRDPETIGAAITAAETGHLVLGTLHTKGGPETVSRILDAFPAEQQAQVTVQLASNLVGVVSQQLVPRCDQPGRIAAYELLTNSPAVSNIILARKSAGQMRADLSAAREVFTPMDMSLAGLVKQGKISMAAAEARAYDVAEVRRFCAL
ncbi:Twitching mobility protein [Calidithermus terrae]|uniref:Twitching mobility protein n=2 Tax=Calidithermus terrae TaxID=1408545 RepID=A0A399E384_9DEIN|nr:Twitching mobility protein [Calidithermus terrae]